MGICLSGGIQFDDFQRTRVKLSHAQMELLSIMQALRKWKVDLLGSKFFMYTDHKTLLNFDRQKDMSRWQLCWMEELSIYDCWFIYVKGEDNTVADALSRLPYNCVEKKEIWNAEEDAAYPFSYHADTVTIFAPKTDNVGSCSSFG